MNKEEWFESCRFIPLDEAVKLVNTGYIIEDSNNNEEEDNEKQDEEYIPSEEDIMKTKMNLIRGR